MTTVTQEEINKLILEDIKPIFLEEIKKIRTNGARRVHIPDLEYEEQCWAKTLDYITKIPIDDITISMAKMSKELISIGKTETEFSHFPDPTIETVIVLPLTDFIVGINLKGKGTINAINKIYTAAGIKPPAIYLTVNDIKTCLLTVFIIQTYGPIWNLGFLKPSSRARYQGTILFV